MSLDDEFLVQVETSPARNIRLVYADWLEERGDKRAELIRIEEEMRLLPFYGDRYWELKPRRNELRRQVHEEWLERMKYLQEHEPACKDIPKLWHEHWRLLREFTERW